MTPMRPAVSQTPRSESEELPSPYSSTIDRILKKLAGMELPEKGQGRGARTETRPPAVRMRPSMIRRRSGMWWSPCPRASKTTTIIPARGRR